jgi:hypothetical protein
MIEIKEMLAGGVRNNVAQIFNVFANAMSCVATAKQCARNQQQKKCFNCTRHHPCLN